MKKIAVLLVVAVFAGGGMMAGISGQVSHETASPAGHDTATESYTFSFDAPEVTGDGWLQVDVDGCTAVQHPGEPMLPRATHTMTFPLGTHIRDVRVSVDDIQTRQLQGTVAPAPEPVRLDMQHRERVQEPGAVYDTDVLYPSGWLQYDTGAGLYRGEHVTMLSVQAYPARYAPQSDMLQHVDSVTVTVSYELPATPLLTADTYDLLIVTPGEFTGALQPLVEHKEAHGLATKMVTLDEVYTGDYFTVEGRDSPEQVKYFIKNALEDWGISYVMLVGGRNGGVMQERWWCPVRYSHLADGSDETAYLSDLYFADIYAQDGADPVFASWDSNGNGVFAEWTMLAKDTLDMYPDVYVGRLACRNSFEVDRMVDKIITYETTAAGSDWAKRFVGIAGDTYPDSGDLSYYEGELATEAAFNYLDGYEADFRWTSDGTLTSADDIVSAISQGAGFVHFSGHGNPMSWATHPPKDHGTWIGIDVSQFPGLSNEGMYPVTIVGGCHNSQFNVSLLNLLKFRNIQNIYYHSEWSPESWGWWLARKFGGGAIATIANTGYGYGEPGEDCLEKRGRYMELMFFKSYAEGADMLGAAHAQDQTYYMNTFPPMDGRIDCKIVQQWVLLGDPSLKIGGY